jgi:ferredoxin-nitrite reductase
MRGVADLAERYGTGLIRLTVWQNLLISDIKGADLPEVQCCIEQLGLHWNANNIRGGVIACTGNTGCKFAATNTKAHGREIIAYLEEHYALDQPINIHLTGCPHSCAQHYIGDIGMLGAKVEEDDDFIEGYHIFVGGGYGAEQQVARELFRNITAIEAPRVVGEMIAAYQGNRLNPEETFAQFASRLEIDQLKALCGSTGPAEVIS